MAESFEGGQEQGSWYPESVSDRNLNKGIRKCRNAAYDDSDSVQPSWNCLLTWKMLRGSKLLVAFNIFWHCFPYGEVDCAVFGGSLRDGLCQSFHLKISVFLSQS
jgi:hypothetical protein